MFFHDITPGQRQLSTIIIWDWEKYFFLLEIECCIQRKATCHCGNTFQGQKIADYINLVSTTSWDPTTVVSNTMETSDMLVMWRLSGVPIFLRASGSLKRHRRGLGINLFYSQSSTCGRSPRPRSGSQRTVFPGISGYRADSITAHTWKEKVPPLGRGDAAEGPEKRGMTS